MQVILGAGGSIGQELAKRLKFYTDDIRLFGRKPEKINNDDELSAGNLLNPSDVEKATEGCDVAYLTAGIQYNSEIWKQQWPLIMQNTINACEKSGTKLVFFDNMYLYHPGKTGRMTEETEIAPSSKKGKVRAELNKMITNEISKGKLTALVSRAADFYGPGIRNSFLNDAVINNLRKGKKANWLASVNKLHNFTYTPDAAKATALLGNTAQAYGQVWHLPSSEAMTGKQWIEMIAGILKVEPKIQVATKPMLYVLGLFNPIMKEFIEMNYQYDRDYIFDSSKFENTFGLKPTPVKEAISQITAI